MQLIDLDALSGFESALSAVRVTEGEVTAADTFYAMLTAHPIVGIYGFAYMCVMGAFYFLVPYLLQTEIHHKRLVVLNFWLQIIGVSICWGAGFFLLFNALYTLYWPLPVAYDHVPLLGSVLFGLGLVIIEINVLLFGYNLIRTVLRRGLGAARSFGSYLSAAFGIAQLKRRLAGKAFLPEQEEPPVFIVAVARGSIDTAINAIVMLSAGALLLAYGLPLLAAGLRLNPASIDALLYKNWFWWGLDMIADGNVLMYTAGTWYLLVPLLVNRRLYGESVVRWVILGDLLVSLFVWSHHLMADRPQPMVLKLVSGQFITWGEFFTMGLTMFAVLMTIWKARPVKLSPGLKFILGSIFGFMVGGIAGLTQANLGLNVVLHNTQWVIGIHAHTLLLAGLSMLLFAVIYYLIPVLTGLQVRSRRLVNLHFWGWILGAMTMSYAMGMAGSQGMLRRTLYEVSLYQPYMIAAMFGAILMSVAFILFLVNILTTLGWSNILAIITPGHIAEAEPSPA
jgi:cytochrome c oxidase subunit 1